MKYRETIRRAIRTFAQAAVGYIVANIALIKWDDAGALKTTVAAVITTAIAAGLAAVMNLPGGKDENKPTDN